MLVVVRSNGRKLLPSTLKKRIPIGIEEVGDLLDSRNQMLLFIGSLEHFASYESV